MNSSRRSTQGSRKTRSFGAPLPDSRRTVSQVIETAVAENRHQQYFLYAFTIGLTVAGVLLVAWSISQASNHLTLIGAALLVAVGQIVALAAKIRKENIKIRLLQTSLVTATTPDELQRVLRSFLINLPAETTKEDEPREHPQP